MASGEPIYSCRMYFSYKQFHVFDSSVKLPGCAWTEGMYKQGFARQQATVNFGTLLEFGHGDVSVWTGPYETKNSHERVIEVPIEVLSGEIVIGGPEEYPNKYLVKLPTGHYRLVAAQAVTADDREAIDLYFDKLATPLVASRIILADGELEPSSPLIETAETA